MNGLITNDDISPPDDPWPLFREWYVLAEKHEPHDPNAMALATVGAGNMPSVRMVLLKEFDERGLVFFTNRQSVKGVQLTNNPKAALCLYWKSLRRQIRAEGSVQPVTDAESDAYFATRSRGAQIGAWASEQSRPLKSRAEMEWRADELSRRFLDKPVPRPPHWGGYRITPLMIEFWQEREYRLHDRIVYHRANDKTPWTQERLYP